MRINVSSLNLGTRQGCVKIEINSNPFYRNTSLRFKPPSDQRKARWTVKIVQPTNKMMTRKKRRWRYISTAGDQLGQSTRNVINTAQESDIIGSDWAGFD